MWNGRNMRIVSMDESFMLIPTPKNDHGNLLENQGRVKVSTPIVFFITKWFNGFFVNWFNYIPNSIFLLLSGGSIAPTSPKPDLNESQSSQEVPIVMDESGLLPDPVEEVCIINISLVVGPEKQDFWTRIKVLEGKKFNNSVDECQFVKNWAWLIKCLKNWH